MDEINYYAMLGSERVGPMSLDELRNLGLSPDTPVWKTGLPEWVNASTLPELASVFSAVPPFPGQPQQPYGKSPYGQPQQAYGPVYGGGQQQPYGNEPPRPDNYLVWSIVVTVCCCLVGGIVALIYSSKVNQRYDEGDYQGAIDASNTAKTWCIVSAVLGFIGSILYGCLMAFGALADL